jgi:hypothetical protein
MKERQYEVEVYEKHSHGCWGKVHYFGWILSSDKRENAESFALEILAGMTPNDIHKESDGKFNIKCLDTMIPNVDGTYKWMWLPLDTPIGYEEAEKRFSTKARLLRG